MHFDAGIALAITGVTQGYPASGPNSVRPHAVITTSSALNGNYGYDSNGNMTTRLDAGVTYTQSWDAQNRLGSVAAPARNTAWVYDPDGARVSKNDGAITTVYIGGSVESLPRRKPGSRSAGRCA